MEGQNFEKRESSIESRIEELAEREGMSAEDISSDILTFAELYEGDADAGGYLEEVAEKIGVSLEEIIKYSQKLREG